MTLAIHRLERAGQISAGVFYLRDRDVAYRYFFLESVLFRLLLKLSPQAEKIVTEISYFVRVSLLQGTLDGCLNMAADDLAQSQRLHIRDTCRLRAVCEERLPSGGECSA